MSGVDRIFSCSHVGEYGLYFPEAVEAEGEYGGTAVEYVRRDPAVLAALPEVQALLTSGTGLVSALCDDPDVMAKSHLVDLINELAAAIRAIRKGGEG